MVEASGLGASESGCWDLSSETTGTEGDRERQQQDAPAAAKRVGSSMGAGFLMTHLVGPATARDPRSGKGSIIAARSPLVPAGR